MKFVFIQIIFLVFVKVLCVKSECDTYSGCLHQIYDGFVGSFINFTATETQVGDTEIPGFENVNIESNNVDSFLKTVAGILEELVGNFDLNSSFNVFHDIDNKTSIFVKTVNIADNLEDFHNVDFKIENKNNFDELNKASSTEQYIETTTKVQNKINGITPINIVSANIKLDKTRNPVLDINELSKRIKENEIIDTDSYDYINENSTDYSGIDYIDLYKDTTNEYIEIKPTTVSTYEINKNKKETTPAYNNLINVDTNNRVYTEECTNGTDTADVIFPWVTAIFIKNETTNQFDYFCDGALLSDTVVITAASCIQKPNTTSEDLLVVLGKRSLRVMAENEIIAKINDIHIHDNFTGTEQNLALLVMKDPVTLSDRVEPARLGDGGDESAVSEGSTNPHIRLPSVKLLDFKFYLQFIHIILRFLTTGWAIFGELTLISFEVGKHDCNNNLTLNTFCALYGNDVTVCPSYGGVYVTRQSNDWFLRGIRTDEPMNNSFCVDPTVAYTDLKSYSDWIHLYVK